MTEDCWALRSSRLMTVSVRLCIWVPIANTACMISLQVKNSTPPEVSDSPLSLGSQAHSVAVSATAISSFVSGSVFGASHEIASVVSELLSGVSVFSWSSWVTGMFALDMLEKISGVWVTSNSGVGVGAAFELRLRVVGGG